MSSRSLKTTPGQEVHKFYPFQALFWLTGGFKNTRLKWHILPLVWVVQPQNAFSFRGLRPLTPVIGSRSTLAMSSTRAFCPPHCFWPGDAPDSTFLSSQCVNCCTVNTFENIFQLNWNRKRLNYISLVLFEIVDVIWRLSRCLLVPAVSSTLLASGKSVKPCIRVHELCAIM